MLVAGGYPVLLGYLSETFPKFNALGWQDENTARIIETHCNWFLTHLHPASVRISKHYILASDKMASVQQLDDSERVRTIEELFNFILPRIA